MKIVNYRGNLPPDSSNIKFLTGITSFWATGIIPMPGQKMSDSASMIDDSGGGFYQWMIPVAVSFGNYDSENQFTEAGSLNDAKHVRIFCE